METDYYKILNIEKTATKEEIKKAYRKLSIKWHPDKNLDDTENATKKFKEITEAYEILSDEEKRSIYDQYGIEGLKNNRAENENANHNPFDIFRQFFGSDDNDSNSNGNSIIRIQVEMTLEELFTTTKKEITFNRRNICKACKSTGYSVTIPCKKCNGEGCLYMRTPFGIQQCMCNECHGSKYDPGSKKCQECRSKNLTERYTMEILIPKGYCDGEHIIIENEGNMISDGSRTNVAVFISEIEHPIFKRDVIIPELRMKSPLDISLSIELEFSESLYGFKKIIPYLDGTELIISYPNSVRHNDILIFKGKGMPLKDDESFSDLFIKINVKRFDSKINEIEKNSLCNLLKIESVVCEKTLMTYEEYIKKLKKKYKNNGNNNSNGNGSGNNQYEQMNGQTCVQQ